MNICKNCKHLRRGEAIDRRVGRDRGSVRHGRIGGDYICAAHEIKPGRIDPQTGAQGRILGEDCRDLNPNGDCEKFVRAGLLARIFR